jgi:hypothetical protein
VSPGVARCSRTRLDKRMSLLVGSCALRGVAPSVASAWRQVASVTRSPFTKAKAILPNKRKQGNARPSLHLRGLDRPSLPTPVTRRRYHNHRCEDDHGRQDRKRGPPEHDGTGKYCSEAVGEPDVRREHQATRRRSSTLGRS